jgi:UDP-2-acetamido-2,6-beta-L-arabino-hexul-4-ose reductase
MKSIGITGQNGFVGYYLYQRIRLLNEEFRLIEFQRDFFDDKEKLHSFVMQCDVVVHLAAINRHPDAGFIYETNRALAAKLGEALRAVGKPTHVIFTSSSQEALDNLYGKSKKESRLMLADWSGQSGGVFTGMVVPNVFGPFGKPNYNSVVATFCHRLTHDEIPVIDVDRELSLIYVGELVDEIIRIIRTATNDSEHEVEPTAQVRVSEILKLLSGYKQIYMDKGEFPALNTRFEHQLFNTFRCYMDVATYFPRKLTRNADQRGVFVEIARLGLPGQVSFSTTHPGITRGNHFHTRKIERFAVISGRAQIQLRKIGTQEVIDFYLNGEEPAYVDMPIWYSHNIRNIGTEPLYTLFWINEPFDPADPDTYFEAV